MRSVLVGHTVGFYQCKLSRKNTKNLKPAIKTIAARISVANSLKLLTECAWLDNGPSSTSKRWEKVTKSSALLCLLLRCQASVRVGSLLRLFVCWIIHTSAPISWERFLPLRKGATECFGPFFIFFPQEKLAFIFSSARKCLPAPDSCASPDFVVCWLRCRRESNGRKMLTEVCWDQIPLALRRLTRRLKNKPLLLKSFLC